MLRGKITAIDTRGLYVQTADWGILGPCQHVGTLPTVGASVLVADVGDNAASPDLVVLGAVPGVAAASGTGTPSGMAAAIGSTWRQTDTNSTYGDLAGLLWHKVSTGTTLGTDWLVDLEGRWIDWAPTLANITRGTGYTQRNRYTITGRALTFDFALYFGSAGSVSADPSITLPVTPASGFEKQFPAMFRTTGTYSLGMGYHQTGAEMTFYAMSSAGTLLGDYASVTGLSGSWATTGRIHVTGTYEIA